MKKVAQTMIVADCYYTIANLSGKVLEGAASTENGAAIQLATYTKAENQEWSFLRMGEGVYRIKNRGTGMMMDLVMNGTADGTWLHQWQDVNGSSQLWIVEAGNDGTVKIKTQLAPTKCVDVVGMSNEDGARIQIWQDVNGENQKWTINEVKERKAAEEKKAPAKKAAAKKATAKAEPVVEAAPAEVAPAAEEKPVAEEKKVPAKKAAASKKKSGKKGKKK